MLLEPGSGWILLLLLPFVAVAGLVVLFFRRPPLWRRVAGGILLALSAFCALGASGSFVLASEVGFNAGAAIPTALASVAVAVLFAVLAVVALCWRLPPAGQRAV